MKGRKRTPTATLILTGSAQKNAARMRRQGRGHEPQPDPHVGRAPRCLSVAQRALWRELLSEIPPHVATKADRTIIEVAVRMVERMRHRHGPDCFMELKSGKVSLCCAMDMTASDFATLTRCLSQMGMTPEARNKIQVTPDHPESKGDEFSEFTAAPGAEKKPVN